MKINLIYAATKNNIIGKNNNLPWKIKDELKYFQKTTIGNGNNAVVMGYTTFASLNCTGLKNRFNIVMTKDKTRNAKEDVFFCDTINKVLWYCKENNIEELYVIGGKQIYEIFLKEDIIDTIYFSNVKEDFDGDTVMATIDWSQYQLTSINETRQVDYFVYTKNKEIHNYGEHQYLSLLQKILKNYTTTYSSFGDNNMKFDLRNGQFPLLTTKRVFLKGIIHELLWFIRGETDVTKLKDLGVNIWNANSSREYLDSKNLTHLAEYDPGPIYGFNFRSFGGEYRTCKEKYIGKGGFDQVQYVLDTLRENPSSRRAIINLWNPMQLQDVSLPACHVLYQFKIDEYNQLSCSLFQRSGDMFLGVPFNIASASLLVYILAKLLGCQPGFLYHTIGDAHIYKEHVQSVEEQIKRNVFPFPKIIIKNRNQTLVEDFEYDDFTIEGYRSHGKLVSPIIV